MSRRHHAAAAAVAVAAAAGAGGGEGGGSGGAALWVRWRSDGTNSTFSAAWLAERALRPAARRARRAAMASLNELAPRVRSEFEPGAGGRGSRVRCFPCCSCSSSMRRRT